MRSNVQKILALLLAALTLFGCLPLAAAQEQPFQTLQKGSRGEDVLRMKRRLRELDYFNTDDLNDKFNDYTVKALKTFQKKNGLEADGIFDEETAQALYADTALSAEAPTPLPSPRSLSVPWPERDGEGYLAGDGEFWYENDEDGVWAYLTQNLQIVIAKMADKSIPLEWFETDIHMRGGETFRSVETNPEHPGTRFRYPFDIATDNKLVLGFTDDFYGHRMEHKQTVGIVIRDGQVLSEKTYSKQRHGQPNLDMLAQFPDGSLKAYGAADVTAGELLEMGVTNVFCFGPVLLSDGEINPLLEEHYQAKSPRQALGMIEPGHYFLLSVQGRMKTSEGCGLPYMARLMKERGVVEALNLDGGNTIALVFRGRMLNRLNARKYKKYVRSVTSLIGVGVSESALPASEE